VNMTLENFFFYIFVCLVVSYAVWGISKKIESRLMRVLVRSLLVAACFSFTILPGILSPYEASMPVPVPVLMAVIYHLSTYPETIMEYLLNWYIYPFFFLWVVSFSVGYFVSVAKAQTGPPNYKKSDGTEWLQ